MSGWGGARIGAGTKPRPKAFDAERASGPVDLLTPPSYLLPDEQDCWRAYAPLAIERLTLTPATAPGFELLCQVKRKLQMVGSMVESGKMSELRMYMQSAKQLENLMKNFCLMPFGKPAKSEKPKPKHNPFSSLT